MKRPFLAFALSLLAFAAFEVAVSGEDAPPPTAVYTSTFTPSSFPAAAPGAPFDLFHLVVEAPPGGRTGAHSHPFGCVMTVIEGQVTNRVAGADFVGVSGKTLVFPAGQFGNHGNDSSVNRARFLASGFTKVGDPIAAGDPSAPAPAIAAPTLFSARRTIASPPAQFNVVQVVVDLRPGAAIPLTRANGPGLVSVLEGEIVAKVAGVERRLSRGQSFNDEPGQTHEATNATSTTTRLVATYLVPPGSAPVSPASITPPSTGDAGLRNAGLPSSAIGVAALAAALLATLALLRRSEVQS